MLLRLAPKKSRRRDLGTKLQAMAGVVVDLDHWRRARRLLPILVDRHGLAFFLDDHVGFPAPPVLHECRLQRCVDVAAGWLERRSGRLVDDVGRETLLGLLRQLLLQRVLMGSTIQQR
jgi:hypothetical protein